MGRRCALFAVLWLVGVAWAVGPAAAAKTKPKKLDFRATMTANLLLSHHSHQSRVEGGCTITSSFGFDNRLGLVSKSTSILSLDPESGSLRGVLRNLAGALYPAGSGASMNSCTRQGVISDTCAMFGPKALRGGSVGVFARPGRPVVFSKLRFASGRYCGDSELAGALNLAPGMPSRAELLRKRTIVVTGSHKTSVISSDGTEVNSKAVAWTLRLVRVR
jgi:hypothetical protein